MNPKERISVTIDPEVLARIDRIAELREQSRSRVIERLLSNGLEEEEEFFQMASSVPLGSMVQALVNHPTLIASIAKLLGDELTDEKLARLEAFGPELKRTRERMKQENHKGRRTDLDTGVVS